MQYASDEKCDAGAAVRYFFILPAPPSFSAAAHMQHQLTLMNHVGEEGSFYFLSSQSALGRATASIQGFERNNTAENASVQAS